MNTEPKSGEWPCPQRNEPGAARTRMLLLLLLLSLPVMVQAQFEYTNNNGTITITGYTGPGGAVTIPDETNGLPVTSVADSAFRECTSLTGITFGTNITSVGGYVFHFCTNLTSVSLPSSLTRVGDGMFSYCSSLANFSIPNSVTTIGHTAFLGCASLTSISIPDKVTSIGEWAFNGCASLTNVSFPASLTSIGSGVFNDCPGLTAIAVDAHNSSYSSVDGILFSRNQTRILKYPEGKGASYSIPNSVTAIGSYAFAYSSGLTNLTIPNSVTNIWSYAFSFCTSLTNITVPNSVATIGYAAFADCHSLRSVTIPDSVTRIDRWAFGNCTSLTNITIPKSVRYLGTQAFDNSRNLVAIEVDALNPAYCSVDGVLFDRDLTTLLRYPEGKAGTSYAVPDTVTTIGEGAFYYCTKLNTIRVPGSVTAISNMVFYLCTHLYGLYFEGNAPTVGVNTFAPDRPTVYYLSGTTGWGSTFAGAPTALWPPPTIQTPPRTQTAEAGSVVVLRVTVRDPLPSLSLWHLNGTNFVGCTTNDALEMTNVQFAQSGIYTVVVTNAAGAVTSSPALLNVIPAVERRPAAGVQLSGEAGTVLNVDGANALSATPNWFPLATVTLANTPQYCFDVTEPLPSQRFYRAWHAGPGGATPSLGLRIVPAITLAGSVGNSVRVDYINRFGPTDAWVTLNTANLTNTSQLYFDISAPGQPERLYRLVPLP